MKSKTICGAIFLALAGTFALWPGTSAGQARGDDPTLAPLLEEVMRQQDVIVQNQKTMEEKFAVIAENVRLARLFTSRGGGSAGGVAPIPGK